MKKIKRIEDVKSLHLEATCINTTNKEFVDLCKNKIRVNKIMVNSLVKNYMPDLYSDLHLNNRNPYYYFITDTHIILVHRAIEYFIKYELN